MYNHPTSTLVYCLWTCSLTYGTYSSTMRTDVVVTHHVLEYTASIRCPYRMPMLPSTGSRDPVTGSLVQGSSWVNSYAVPYGLRWTSWGCAQTLPRSWYVQHDESLLLLYSTWVGVGVCSTSHRCPWCHRVWTWACVQPSCWSYWCTSECPTKEHAVALRRTPYSMVFSVVYIIKKHWKPLISTLQDHTDYGR